MFNNWTSLTRISSTNFTVNLDGITLPPPATFSPLGLSAPTAYDVSLYDKQSLPLSFHDLIIASTAMMFFDYAYVNETNPASTS